MARPAPTPPDAPAGALILHASCVAHSGRAVLIRGASGRGKSALALQLLALGAGLVADDRTCLWRDGGQVRAAAPAAIAGLIEARGVGLLRLPVLAPQPLALVVDLDATETARLPAAQTASLLGLTLPLMKNSAMVHFPAAILLYLRHGEIV